MWCKQCSVITFMLHWPERERCGRREVCARKDYRVWNGHNWLSLFFHTHAWETETGARGLLELFLWNYFLLMLIWKHDEGLANTVCCDISNLNSKHFMFSDIQSQFSGYLEAYDTRLLLNSYETQFKVRLFCQLQHHFASLTVLWPQVLESLSPCPCGPAVLQISLHIHVRPWACCPAPSASTRCALLTPFDAGGEY